MAYTHTHCSQKKQHTASYIGTVPRVLRVYLERDDFGVITLLLFLYAAGMREEMWRK